MSDYGLSLFGPDAHATTSWGGGNVPTTYAMAALNTGWDARFVATKAKTISGVRLNWSSVTTPGTVQLRIETTSAGKPSGTLYDANASQSFTPTAGNQLVTFGSAPTTNLTVGTEYHVVLLTTVAGTTQTLRSHWLPLDGRYPYTVLTAANGTTRTNFAPVTSALPICSLVYTDTTEDALRFLPYATGGSFAVYGTRAAGMKFTIANSTVFRGIDFHGVATTGTPADILFEIYNGSSLISGSSVTVSKDSIANLRTVHCPIPDLTLAAGTYRAVFGASGRATTSGNNITIYYMSVLNANLAPADFQATTTTDVTAGTITWTDVSGDAYACRMHLGGQSTISGGGGILVHPGMTGRMAG